ncbi:MAG: hypothetical protein JWO54_943 [Candidatus Saccharibacteria bacterium]|nr:hypothetical protein [Candidatus Saccharibacteria bacterium]MDB5181180.1 hypothetical protein [Candidatus Saccharibacteria bacterium]
MGLNPSGSGLSAATDVSFSNPTNDQVITYNSSTSKWQNKTFTGGGSSSITSVTGNVVMYSTDPAARGTTDQTKVVLFITSTQPTAMLNNDIWLSQLTV